MTDVGIAVTSRAALQAAGKVSAQLNVGGGSSGRGAGVTSREVGEVVLRL